MKSKGIVYLVGAGPGDAGLITVRGAELLGRADVVVYDALVNLDLLRYAKPDAELIYAGKRSNAHAIPQEQLNQLLIDKAVGGKCVVRLKGGDPYVFGRGGEEAGELAAAGVAFEVVPGISSSIAGPNYAGIPVTHRGDCAAFTVLTGHEDPTKDDPEIDWLQVAKTPGTKIVLMGVSRIREIGEALVSNGMAADTPVAMIRWATTGRQQTVCGTLKTMAEVAEKAEFKPPGLMVIGEVVKLRAQLNWFEKRPLFGRRIVVTRTREQASQLSSRLLELGADVLEIPTIRIGPPSDRQVILDVMLELNAYDWLVFTSPNGVTAFFDLFFKAFQDMRDLGGARIAAVGPATAAKLRELHLKVDVTPLEYVAAKVAEAMAADGSLDNLKVLLLRAEVANRELPLALESMGAIVDEAPIYKTVPETDDRTGAAARLMEEGADWITFASSSAVENFHARLNLKELLTRHPKIKLASIGPETSKAIKALDLKVDLEAKEHTIEGLVKTLLSQ
ncbi:MAG TPA: uroporphyrinogen-III C-methyltransferase [Verrucomicrobiae bacterium]|jgi:uroporphyrinogen III methyltransferase/synthase|nr:uroporphyrinogen-III C-methyltransferase [Verrucomicrobiae bacterium]